MKTRKYYLTLICISLFALNSNSQVSPRDNSVFRNNKSDTTYEILVENFFNEYKVGNVKPALKNLFATNDWLNSSEKVNLIYTNLNLVIKQIDKYQGYLPITKKSVGTLVLCSYMVLYNRQPLRFTFIFYKPNDKWILYDFSYDDKMDEELKEAARVNRLYENMPFK